MKTTIYLRDLRFYAYHGVGAQENLIGNEFVVNLRMEVDMRQAMTTDEVSHTVSYADVHAAIADEMRTPSRLLEHVAGRVVSRLFDDFEAIQTVTLELGKRNPPMGADIAEAGVAIEAGRYEWSLL